MQPGITAKELREVLLELQDIYLNDGITEEFEDRFLKAYGILYDAYKVET